MDKIDRKILAILKRNARLTASAISDEIDLSVSAVIERIKKMESNNTIIGYTVSVDNKIIGNSLTAIIEVKMKNPDYFDAFSDFIMLKNYVDTCYYKTGDYDFVLHVATDSTEGLDKINREIKGFEGVSSTETHIVLKTIKNELSVLPED